MALKKHTDHVFSPLGLLYSVSQQRTYRKVSLKRPCNSSLAFCLNNLLPSICLLSAWLYLMLCKGMPSTLSLRGSGWGSPRTGAISLPTYNRTEVSAVSSALADSGRAWLAYQGHGRIHHPWTLTHWLWDEVVSIVQCLCPSGEGTDTHMLSFCKQPFLPQQDIRETVHSQSHRFLTILLWLTSHT